ncbi:MAG TPA: HAD hydrolase-like protein, partial [Bacillota bacterium]|nr:HAD hydrolase-like protein [Bacillota bacterium]
MTSPEMLWKQDIYLLQLDNEEVKLVSCDIFDTLIFRTTVTPHDLFLVLGREAKEKGLLKNIEPEEFKELRIRAEKKAQVIKEKEQGTFEANLYEIYDQMPFESVTKEELLELELNIEKKCLFLNPSIASLLRYYHEKGIPVVLLSDMYLFREQVEDLLASVGFDCAILDDIIISSQYLVSKWNKGLYQVLLDKYSHISPSEMIHIGDNYHTDVVNALKCGMRAIHYKSRQDTGSAFELERYRRSALLPEMFFLRKLAGQLSGEFEAGKRFWFEFGATVIGPFLSVFAEWVVDTAINNGIQRIYPLMREGAIISEFIRNSLRERENDDIVVKPLYVSRRSSFLSSLDDMNETVIKDYIMAQTWSPLVSGIFTQLKLDNVFEKYSNVKLPDTHEIIMESGKTLFQELTEY